MTNRQVKVLFLIFSLGLFLVGDTQAIVPDKEKENTRSGPEQLHLKKPGPLLPQDISPEPPLPEYAPGELIVKFSAATKESLRQALLSGSSRGLSEKDRFEQPVDFNARLAPSRINNIDITLLKDINTKYKTKIEPVCKGLHRQLYSQGKDFYQLEVDKLFKQGKAKTKTQAQDKAKTLPDLSSIYLLKIEGDVQEAVRDYNQLKEKGIIEYVEPNYKVKVQMYPNDPYYSSSGSWGQSYADLWGIKKIQCEQAWDISQGEGVVVAVIDTGIDYNHEDIAANIWTNPGEIPNNGRDDDNNGFIDDIRGWDFGNNDNNPMDVYGHGTHCAGTIAAVGNNSKGVIGVAPQAKVMAVKGFEDSGNGYTDDLANALVYAADNGARVLSNSWIGKGSSSAIENAVNYAYTFGCVIVAAAGNDNADVANYYPANLPNVIAVAASTQNDEKCSFSNYGAKIDVSAPGGGYDTEANYGLYNILSTMSDNSNLAIWYPFLKVANGYYRLAGTSMACPHVAGVAASVLARNPTYTNNQVRQTLRISTDDVGEPGFDINFGYGRINTLKALNIPTSLDIAITQPSAQVVSGVDQVEVWGTARGEGFTNWRLEYGIGSLPTQWTNIASSTTPVNNGVLAIWDIRNIVDGTYTLRLTASNTSGQTFEDRKNIIIDQVVLTEPTPTHISFFRGGQIISIRGTVSPIGFSYYTFKIQASNGIWLSNPNITLTHGGLQKMYDSVLATWDTADVSTDYYNIYLSVILTDGTEILESTWVVVDPTLHEGWPQNLGLLGTLAIADHLDAADINGDGQFELIVGYGSSVRIFDHTGAMLSGWPQTVDPDNTGAVTQVSPVVGDLTGDGLPEIVASNNLGQIFIWEANGHLLPGWPKRLDWDYYNVLCIGDINADGINEIIATTWNWKVKVFDRDGVMLPGWPRELRDNSTSSILSPAVIGDVDRDGKKEIVVVNLASPTNLYILRFDGAILPGWPKAVSPAVTSGFKCLYPVLGDLDDDGDLEVVMGSLDGKVYAFHHDGSLVSGWPQQTRPVTINGFAIGDLDGDGKVEVVAGISNVSEEGQWANYLFAWHGDGALVEGWPVRKNVTHSNFRFGFCAPILADIDNNGRVDIVVSSDTNDEYPFALNAYQSNGVMLNGFPKPTPSVGAWNINTAAVADLDKDNLLELAWIDLEGNLFVWDLPGTASAKSPWPMFAHDPQHTGCYSTPDTTPPTVTITYPISGAIVSGDITVIASASDNIGVSNVEVYLDDITKLGEDNTAPYDIPWDTTQTGEGQHTLTAIARDIAGNTTTSQAVTVTVDNRPPAPSDLIAKASSFNQIDLTWEDNSNNELGFIIERSLDPNPTSNSWSQIAKVGTGITSYSDTNNLKPNTTYYYRLKAYNNIGESAYSNIATATTPSEAYSVSGKVYAVIRGKQLPLQGATVTLALPKAPLKVITGSDGSYQFKDIPPGTYTITATKKGYFSQLKRIKVKTNLTNVNFYLLAKPKKGRF